MPAKYLDRSAVRVGRRAGAANRSRPARRDLLGLVIRGDDIMFAFPALLLAILIVAITGPGKIGH